MMKYFSAVEDEPTAYRAFILRWWIESMDGDVSEWQWRFLLEDMHDRQVRWGFDNFSELVDFLRKETAESSQVLVPKIVFGPIKDHEDS